MDDRSVDDLLSFINGDGGMYESLIALYHSFRMVDIGFEIWLASAWGPENRNVWITFKPNYGLICLVESEYDML